MKRDKRSVRKRQKEKKSLKENRDILELAKQLIEDIKMIAVQ